MKTASEVPDWERGTAHADTRNDPATGETCDGAAPLEAPCSGHWRNPPRGLAKGPAPHIYWSTHRDVQRNGPNRRQGPATLASPAPSWRTGTTFSVDASEAQERRRRLPRLRPTQLR